MGLERALERNENKSLFPYPEAYFRVENMNSSNGNMSFSVYGYPDKTSRDGSTGADPMPHPMMGGERDRIIFDHGYSVPINQLSVPTPNADEKLDDLMKRSLYAHLKTLGEFENCVDVFEDGQA